MIASNVTSHFYPGRPQCALLAVWHAITGGNVPGSN